MPLDIGGSARQRRLEQRTSTLEDRRIDQQSTAGRQEQGRGAMGNCLGSAAAYPGNKRAAHPVYQPGPEEFRADPNDPNTAIANVHFVTCPGGNALKLVGKPNRVEQTGSDTQAQYISVTLPANVHAGDVIHVKAPDGRLNAITVPQGMGPGSTFTVEFSADTPSPAEEDLTPGVYVPTVEAEPDIGVGYPASAVGVETAVAQPTTYVPASYAK